jgi:hypothetical protein
VINGVSGLTGVLGYHWQSLNRKNSDEEFNMLQGCLDNDSTGTESVKGDPAAELAQLLQFHDRDGTFFVLRSPGVYFWTADTGVAATRYGGGLETNFSEMNEEWPADAETTRIYTSQSVRPLVVDSAVAVKVVQLQSLRCALKLQFLVP